MTEHGLADYRTEVCDRCNSRTFLRHLRPSDDYTALLCPKCRAVVDGPTTPTQETT